MNININVTKEDFKAYSQFACSRFVSSKLSAKKGFFLNLFLWFCLAVVLSFVLNYFEIRLNQFHWPSAIVAAIPFVLFAFLFMRNMKKIERGSTPKNDGLVLGERCLEFSDEGVKDTCELGYFYYQWEAVQEIVSSDGSIYLCIDGLMAQIIPKSSFASASEYNEFLGRVNSMHREAIKGMQ